MSYPTITGSGPNSRTNLQNIHSGKRSFQIDLNTTHSQVALMQIALTNNGYNTHRVDGKFDNNTLNAVKAFQRANGLTDDGYFGRSSLLKLEQLIGGHLDPTLGGCTDSGTGGNSGGGTYMGKGAVVGGRLYCRKQPKPKYESWGQFQNGTVIPIYSCSTSGWYETRWPVGGNNVGYVMSKFVSMNGGGSTGTGSLAAGHYVKMNQSNSLPVNVRASASTGSKLLGKLQKGTLMYCEEVVNSTWVKIRWGGKTQTYAYIQSKYLVDGGIAPSSKMQRAIDIGKSMANAGYPNEPDKYFDIGHGKWCVRYVSFLQKAAGCSSSNYVPFSDAYVSEAAAFFQGKGKFGLRSQKIPTKGDWVFFSQGSETYQHVGLIVNVSGTNITTVEGNMNGTVISRGPGSYKGSFGKMKVYGFATPTWE